MFKVSLSEKLQRIFDLDKVSFDQPGESQEQECTFVVVENALTKIMDARQVARVTGKIHVFAQVEKLPYGYFAKRIAAADPGDTKDFFFYGFDENKGTFRNIAERTMSFVYLFDSQFDPAIGILNELTLSIAET